MGWLFDYYSIIIWWLLWLFELFEEIIFILSNSPNFAFARLCCLKILVARRPMPARPAKVISNLLDSSLQASNVHFDVGGNHHTNARMQTRNYRFCIWNSRIARSVYSSFNGALATSASACRPVKVISDFLDSSLQSGPHAFRCAWCIQPSGKSWPQQR